MLYPASLRDLLIRLAMKRLFQAKWTNTILDEVFRNILKQRPELRPTQLERTRLLMNAAVRDCLVFDYESLIQGLTLPDADDRHVLAAAIRSGAQVIVTFNLKDFPASALKPFSVEARHPDDFVLNLIDETPSVVLTTVQEQAAVLKRPPHTPLELVDKLQQSGLVQSAARLRELLPA